MHVTNDTSSPSTEDDSDLEDADDADAVGAEPTTSTFCVGSEDTAVSEDVDISERQAQNGGGDCLQHLGC